ncbi:uncharacterized protein A4U43_C10F13060 [Asparagus officinalis]|uniref:Thioredoxin domain-containing protein n=1 Tax=Asparagus officinalis TaxID=4686 RepID=A0A5P1E724_ASPOF|nr:uncharacterized protein A4U43_C10F13060 [Asparagus officinalis]
MALQFSLSPSPPSFLSSSPSPSLQPRHLLLIARISNLDRFDSGYVRFGAAWPGRAWTRRRFRPWVRCGPCKVIAPKFQKLSEKYQDVVFMKLDCNQENKALAKELGIKVVPTFKILKDSKVVKEVTGAKFDDLVFAIDTVKSSS